MKRYWRKRNKFVCPNCGQEFEITDFWKWVMCPKFFDIWRLVKCDKCGTKSWMKRVK